MPPPSRAWALSQAVAVVAGLGQNYSSGVMKWVVAGPRSALCLGAVYSVHNLCKNSHGFWETTSGDGRLRLSAVVPSCNKGRVTSPTQMEVE